MHAPIELVGIVGRHAFDAGTAYARQHRAVVRRHDAEARVVTGNVEGSGRNVYSSTAFYDLTRNGTIVSFDGRCSCPVQADCKHTVALLITALEQQRAAQGRPVVSAWRSRLEGIFPDPAATGYEPLALVLDFQAPPPERDTGGHRSAWQVVTEGGLQARPMRRGKRGTWIASGASWAEIQRSAVPSAAPAQLDALTALARMNQASQAYGYGAPTWLDLHRITSRALWPALEDLVAAGVALIEPDGEPAVLLDSPGRAELAVSTRGSAASADGAGGAGEDEHHDGARDGDPGDLHLEAVVTSEADLRSILLLGLPPHGVVGRDACDTLTLVPLEVPASREWLDLRRSGRVTVPVAERSLFERTILPRLPRAALRTSGWEPAPPPAPTLVVRIRLLFAAIGSTPRASVEAEWRYGRADDAFARTATLPPDPRDTGRDAAAERDLLVRAGAAMSALPPLLAPDRTPLEEMVVSGHAVVTLLEQVVPSLRAVDGVTLDLPEDVPTFRDLGEPEIAVDVTPVGRDWLDLEVRLRVAEREVPVGQVITALARGEKTLFLEDGGFVSLDRPELDQLRTLLEEGRALQDRRRTGALRMSRLDLSWWEELLALGEIDRQAREWLDRLRAATTDESEPPALPAGLRAELRPYQRTGYEWLARLRRNGLGGVLADDMGLGKTLQVLAMIQDWKENAPSSGTPQISQSQPDVAQHATTDAAPDGEHGPFVVVAPTSVVPNWAAEAARFTPGLRVAVVTATAARRRESIAALAANADVLVTSYALFRLEHDDYAALRPAGLVLDEAQNVKNRQSKAFALAKTTPAHVTFAVTGTPMENDLTELWAMFALAAPGLLGTPQQFHELYAAPIERGNGADLLLRLRRRIAPFLLRRTKEQVAPDLPAKQEQVLRVELDPAHRRVYARHLQRERQRVLGLVQDMEHNRVEVLSALTRLRQLAIDASLVDEEYEGVPSSKLEELMPLLREAADEGHRVLVFSQFTRYLGKIAARLDADGLRYAYLDGSTTRRAEVIRSFAEGDQPVFLISLKAGGVGLNLAMADYCVLADPWWNPAAEAQAVDRAHRIGQTRPVLVYRMVATDTIEEKVMALQESKRALVAGVLGSSGELGGSDELGGTDAMPDGVASPGRRGDAGAVGRLTAQDVRELLA